MNPEASLQPQIPSPLTETNTTQTVPNGMKVLIPGSRSLESTKIDSQLSEVVLKESLKIEDVVNNVERPGGESSSPNSLGTVDNSTIQNNLIVLPVISVTTEAASAEDADTGSLPNEPPETSESPEVPDQPGAEKKVRRKRTHSVTPVATTIYRTRTFVKADLAAQIERDERAQDMKNALLQPNKAKTMKDVLASIPGFDAGRPKKRNNRKLSVAEQVEQTRKEGWIDLETPCSVLTNVKLRNILNKHTFAMLPQFYQFKLLQLLPDVDSMRGSDNVLRASSSALNNEFFAKACEEWTARLLAGDLTPEQKQKQKQEAEREKLKLDPWKVKYFEPIWGEKFAGPTPTTLTSKPPASATATSTASTKSSQNPSSSIRPTSIRSSARLSPSLPLDAESPTPDCTGTPPLEASSAKIQTNSRPVHSKPLSSSEVDDEESEGENDEGDSDQIGDISSVEEEEESRQLSVVPTTSSGPSSPGKRSGSHLDVTDKPPVLVKKIKIIPPMPPSGEQVPYNMEVKIDEILPATPVATPSTDHEFEDGSRDTIVEEDSSSNESATILETSPIPSPQLCVEISDSFELDMLSDPTIEVEIRSEPEGFDESNPWGNCIPKSGENPESTCNFSPSTNYKSESTDNLQPIKNESDSLVRRENDLSITPMQTSPLKPGTSLEIEPKSHPNVLTLSTHTVIPILPEPSQTPSLESRITESPKIELEIVETKPNLEMTSVVPDPVCSQAPPPPKTLIVRRSSDVRPVSSLPSVVVPVVKSDGPILSTTTSSVVPVPAPAPIDRLVYPARLEPQPQIIKILTVPVSGGTVRLDGKGNQLGFPMKLVSLSTGKIPVTAKQIQSNPQVKISSSSGNSSTTVIPMVLKVSNTNTTITGSSAPSASLSTTTVLLSDGKSGPTRPIMSTVVQAQMPPVQSTTTTTATDNVPVRALPPTLSTSNQPQLIHPEGITTFVVNALQNTPIATIHETSTSTLSLAQNSQNIIIQQQQLNKPNPNPLQSLAQSVVSGANTAISSVQNVNSLNNINNKRNRPKTKQIKISRSSTGAPPGSINLERSYQICQAVIQSSPNREQLQNQLVKPKQPPVLVSSKMDATKLAHQQQVQGSTVFGEPQLIQLQRRASTPTTNQGQTSMPLLSGITSNQKLIVAHIGGGQGTSGSPVTIQHQPHPHSNPPMVPLLRPVQPSSPLIVHSNNGRAPTQLVVSSDSPTSSLHFSGKGVVGLRMMSGVGVVGGHSHINSNSTIKSSLPSNSQPQSMGTAGIVGTGTGSTTSSTSAAIITSQQLAMLIQQQQQQQQLRQLQAAQQQGRCQSIAMANQTQHQGSPTTTALPNKPPLRNNPCGSVFICSPRGQIIANSSGQNPLSHTQLKIINSQLPQPPNPNNNSSPQPPTLQQHQIIHIPIQRQAGSGNLSNVLTGNNISNSGATPLSFPLRAQIVTSNGETLTIHRASNAVGEQSFTIRQPQRVQVSQGKQGESVQNYFIASESIKSSGLTVGTSISNFINANSNSPTLIQSPVGTQSTNSLAFSTNPKVLRSPLRIICRSPQDGGFQATSSNVANINANITNSGQNSSTLNPISNLADFITNQIAASNIRPISPLAVENNPRPQSTNNCESPVDTNTNSPDVYLQKSQSFNNFSGKLNNQMSSSCSNQVDQTTGQLMIVKNEMPYCTNSEGVDGSNQTLGNDQVTTNTICGSSEGILDLQDAIVGMDSPYSLISESEHMGVAEIVEVPMSETLDPSLSLGLNTISGSSSLPNFTNANNDCSTTGFVPSYNNSCVNNTDSNSGGNECSRAPQMQIPVTSKGCFFNNVQTSYYNTNSFNPSLTSTLPPPPNVNLTNTINENLGLNVPVIVSEVESSSVLVQQTTPQNLQGQGHDNSQCMSNPTPSGQQHEGIRPQQYFIVQTTGSNGFPTNLAVPASMLMQPQVLLEHKQNQAQVQQGIGIRSSSAPPVQHNQPTNIIVNSNGHSLSGNIPISFNTPTSISISGGTANSTRITQMQTFQNIRGQLGDINIKPEMQEVRILCNPRNGPSGIQQSNISLNRGSPDISQGQFLTQNQKPNSVHQPGQYSMTSSGLVPVSHANQAFVQGHQVQLVSNGSAQYSITPVNPTGQVPNSNAVTVQVSRASQPTIVTVGRRQITNGNELWNTLCSQNPHARNQIINVNLNGTSGSPRIITTTQPGQHPVISIPDTTQNGNGSGQDFDIFSAIAKASESIKLEQDAGDRNRGVLISSAGSMSRNASVAEQEFQRLVEDGQITMDNAANCVCDLRAMIMCRKCGAYCRDECIGGNLCMTCITIK